VVLDCETSGLDPHRDSLLSLGAVGVRGRHIACRDWFEATVRPSSPSARENILIHRIGRDRQAAGEEPAHALHAFLEFAGDAPRVAFRAAFDRTVMARALHAVGRRDAARWLDLAALLPVLFPQVGGPAATLDTWCSAFGIEPYLRHDAVADAYATAQLFQIALSRATRQGFRGVTGVLRAAQAGKWTGG
jgi:DNA polymerase-3 subunit epsilon